MVDIQKLRDKLETNIVLIEFQSLKSGKIYDREYTLNEKYMDIPNHIKNQVDPKSQALYPQSIESAKKRPTEHTKHQWSKF